ncbi:hypothetical protein D917_07448 [Trichinella nativa]|uniref:Uncharacterized protein n=1 Tax=Trichinella nativa TaxID=6335 RepID=A0A1Y3EPV0_9BILA|nr:hypothetical protein D917_07448 [Trichinella nativa]
MVAESVNRKTSAKEIAVYEICNAMSQLETVKGLSTMDNLAQRRAAQVRWLKIAMENMEAALDGNAETRQICFAKLMDT